jgi:hypothetical protein
MFGNPEVTSGGNALKFYSSVRVDIRKIEVLKENMGVKVRCKVVKNKVWSCELPWNTLAFNMLMSPFVIGGPAVPHCGAGYPLWFRYR